MSTEECADRFAAITGRIRLDSWTASPSDGDRLDCRATIGEVSNEEHSLRQYGKAGAIRWKGIRPTVRGVVMNPIDHPHGGGEGRTSGGRHPVSPWGKPEGRTRNKNKASTKLIIRRRKSGKKR